MSVALLRSPESHDDVAAVVQYYLAQHTTATAVRFAQAVDATLEWIALFPESGPVFESENPTLQGIRFRSVRGFPSFLVFYRMVEQGVYVMRIVDGRRDLTRVLTGK
ncbi:MAG TPA: type II toxin-antitoxin system RelE/ParE family toxin [Gemmataceae bacterium]|nr:type II toxin-antitoxin system RelE/ParE family toxin [Gemmataceae bacterium]